MYLVGWLLEEWHGLKDVKITYHQHISSENITFRVEEILVLRTKIYRNKSHDHVFSETENELTFYLVSQNGSGIHPVSYPMCTRALSLGVKRLGREGDHSSPSSAEVKE
jgi:hypothetical protein